MTYHSELMHISRILADAPDGSGHLELLSAVDRLNRDFQT